MNHIYLTTLLASLTYCAASVVNTSNNNAGAFELLILHNNDMHARFEQTSQLSGACTPLDREAGKCYGGFPRVAYVVKEARKAAAAGTGPPVLYLNAGDTYTGTPWFTIYKWKIAAEFINALQPDAVSLGNHEFDNGVSGLTPFIENLTCPVLAANLVLNKEPQLEKEPNLKKSIILDVSGVYIGIVGYLTPDTKFIAKPNKVEYINEVTALQEEVRKLQQQGVKIIFALGHSGYKKDLEIAREVDGLDLVIGGHTNTFLWNGESPDSEAIDGPYPTYIKQKSGRRVAVVQAYAYTKYLGNLLIRFNSDGEVVKISGSPILLDQDVPQDPEVIKIINRYRGDVLNVADEVVGNTSVILDGVSCKRMECNLGNFITDAMIHRYVSHYRGDYWTDTAIAMLQGGGIRTSIAHVDLPSELTKGDLLTALPFEGNLAVVTMNGSILLEILEHSVANYESIDEQGEFMQFSGIKVVYDLSKKPGSRVIDALVRCAACDMPSYYPIIEDDVYKVLMPGFLQQGGDGYKMLIGLPTRMLSYSELMCTQHYVRHLGLIYPGVEGRIQLIGLEKSRRNFASYLSSPFYVILLTILFTLV